MSGNVAYLRVIIDSVPVLLAYVGVDQRYRVVNAAFRTWFGPLVGDVEGRHLRDVFGAAGYEVLRSHVERALAGTSVTHEACVPLPDGRRRWLQTHYVPDFGAGGDVRGFVAQVHDVTDRKHVEERLAILARTSEVLAFAPESALARAAIARVALPELADWCVVYVDRSGVLVPEQVAHGPDVPDAMLWELARALAPELTNPPSVHRTGDWAVIAIALAARGERFGALVLGAAHAERWSADDVEFITELGRRCSAALDTAQLFEAQRRANERLAEADRRKDQFLAMLSHELRNPLAPIVTALDLMAYRGMTEFEPERDIIRRQTTHMARLVDDLLDVARITRGKFELRRERVQLAALVANAVELASPLLEQRAHQLALDVPDDLVIDADPMRACQVLTNLLDNAAKYTPQGGHVAIAARRDGDMVAVSVTDDGSGIAAELLPHIFDEFVQDDRTRDLAQGGLGLGLALARRLAELHGGTIEATSDGPGRGTCLTVRFPAAVGDAPPATPPVAMPGPRANGERLLVVDDNVEAASVLASLLRELGYDVAVAHDAPTALAIADEFRPEIALLDLGLPVMDGYELASHLRARLVRPPRLVAVTGYGERHDVARGQQAGFDLQLGKPLDFDRLVAVLDHLGRQHAHIE